MEEASCRKRDAMKLVLILMVRNESKILERCLKAVEDIVDAFCIHDTGSTDTTCEIAEEFLKTHKGCLTTSEWTNFGFNRTRSFVEAQTFIQATTDWSDAYGLLLDADMIFHPGSLRDQSLTEVGYTVIQKNGNLQYPNTRIVRMDYPWTCKGVTHEYWDGSTKRLPESVCWIQDQNDGGCKSDKFERDLRLLEEGVRQEPDNVRYMFYLAQTYHSVGRWKDAIRMYKKRFASGGWDEERWYSLYMIGQTWLSLNDPIKFEMYMLRAFAFRPQRAESVYRLAKYFREKGDRYKSYHYIQLGKSIPCSSDSLFVESDVYDGLFEYESTIVLYYMDRHREGLRQSMSYLLKQKHNLDSVYKNIAFYIEPLHQDVTPYPVLRDVCGRDYHPSSVSTCETIDNVRFVNYSIDQKGGYDMKCGSYSPHHDVLTQNVAWNVRTGARVMQDSTLELPRVPTNIRGLEDIRIYKDSKQTLRYISSSKEYQKDKICIVTGIYDVVTCSYKDSKVIQSPLSASCEKNWLPVNGTEDIIYSWNPLRVGTFQDDTLVFHTTHQTPWFFKHLRGSSIPILVGKHLWCLVHFVEYSSPRKYFHCIVSLDTKTYKPVAISLPFAFRSIGIEYCLSMTVQSDMTLRFIVSSWDDSPCVTSLPLSKVEWIQV